MVLMKELLHLMSVFVVLGPFSEESALLRLERHLCLAVWCYNLMRTLTVSYLLKEIMCVLDCYHKNRGKTHSSDASIPQPHWQFRVKSVHNLSTKEGWRQLSASMRCCCLPPCHLVPTFSPWQVSIQPCHLHGCWPRHQEGWRKPLHSSSSHLPSPRDLQPPTYVTAALVPGQVCRDFHGEKLAACRELHPFLKKTSAEPNPELKASYFLALYWA